MHSTRLVFAAATLSLLQSGCGSDPAATCTTSGSVADSGVDTGLGDTGAGDTGAADTGAADTGADAGDGGLAPSTKGHVRFGISIGNSRVKTVTAKLDGVDLAAFGGQPMIGTAPAFSAGTADEGLEVEAGIHRFSITLEATVVFCSQPIPSCMPQDVLNVHTYATDLTVSPGREQTAIMLYRTTNEGFGGSERVYARLTSFDSTPATSGSLAGVARLQLVREPSILFDGVDTITFGTDPAKFTVEADGDGVMLVPANTGGAFHVSERQFAGSIEQAATLPPVPAGRVLPVLLGGNVSIPSDHAGTGKNLVP
jgi:hypothetical protein